MAQASPPILELTQITKAFGGVEALRGVDFALSSGEIHGLVGENGAGKSTLMKIIAGVHPEFSGRFMLDGRETRFRSTRDARAAGIAMVHQELSVAPDLSVAENLRLAAQVLEPISMALRPVRASRKAQTRVDELLQRFGLAAKAQDAAGTLSHGEQRRLEVAVAVACKPKILLLDEPTQGMSHGDTQETAALIKSLASEVTVLLIEHDIGLVMSLSDHVIVMHQGQILAEGEPTAVRSNPAVQAAYFGHA